MTDYTVSVLSDYSVFETEGSVEYSIASVETHIKNKDSVVGCVVKGELIQLSDILEFSDSYQSDLYEALLTSKTVMQVLQVLDSRNDKVFGFAPNLPISLGLKNMSRIFVVRSVEFRCSDDFRKHYLAAFLSNVRDIFQLQECLFVHPTAMVDFTYSSPDNTKTPNLKSERGVFELNGFNAVGKYNMLMLKIARKQKHLAKKVKVKRARKNSVV